MTEERIPGFVTHVESEGPFIKLWIQKDNERVSIMKQVLSKQAEHFNNGVGVCAPNELQEVQPVCAKFSNGSYYRAKILSLKELSTNGTITVQFIDYGNTESIRVEDIRVLNALICIPSVISQSPALATESILAGVYPPGRTGKWLPQIVESIRQNLCLTKIKCIIEGQILFKDITRVFYGGDVDVASKMIELEFGVEISVSNQISFANHYYAAVMEQLALPDSDHPPVEIPQDPSMFRTMDTLPVGTECLVIISCVDSGIRSFFVQLQQKEKFLSDMMTDLNECPRIPLQTPPVPGSGCFAKYPNEDTSVCRALVTAVNNDMCKLFFLDYGSTATYPYTQLYEIPSRFLTFKPLAYRFYLRGANNLPHDRTIHDSFVTLIVSKLMKLRVVPDDEEGDTTRQCCNLLFMNNKDILLALVHKISALSTVFPTLKLEPNKQYSVVVSHVDRTVRLPWVFYVQLESEVEKLEQLMIETNKYCNALPESTELVVEIGCPILAKYKGDSNWYRARLLSKREDLLIVKFVDYGNDKIVRVTDTRPSHENLNNNLPAQGILCRLQGADTVVQGAEKFSNMTANKSLIMTVIQKLETGELLVRIFDPSSFPTPKDLAVDLLLSTVPPVTPCQPAPSFVLPQQSTHEIEWLNPQIGVPTALARAAPSAQHCYNPPPSMSMASSSRRSSISDMELSLSMMPSSSRDQRNTLVHRPASLAEIEPVISTSDPRVLAALRNPPVPTLEWQKPRKISGLNSYPSFENKEMINLKKPSACFSRSSVSASDGEVAGPSKPPVSNEKWGNLPMQEDRSRASSSMSTNEILMPDFGKPPPPLAGSSGGSSKPSTSNETWEFSNKRQERGPDMNNRDNKHEVKRDTSWSSDRISFANNRSFRDESRDRNDYRERVDTTSSDGRADGDWKHDRYQELGNSRPQQRQSRQPFRQQDTRGSADSESRGRRDDDARSNNSWGSGGSFSRNNKFKKPYQVYIPPPVRGRFDSESSLADESWETPEPPRAAPKPKLRFTSQEMMPGMILQAYGTFLMDPWDFYVQLESFGVELEQLMIKIEDFCKSGGLDSSFQREELEPKDAVLAKFSDDDTWYRAQVMSVKDGKAKVKFVDYGNEEEVDVLTAVKEITSELLTMPAQGIRCKLRGAQPASGAWTDEDIGRFTEILKDKQLEVELVAVEGLRLMQFSVVLRLDNICLNEQFGASPASLLPCKSLPEQAPVPDKTEVLFTWFSVPDDFHVIRTDRMKERDDMQEEMKNMEVPALQTVEVGDLVLAIDVDDGTFFRGLVIAAREPLIKVYSLDGGFVVVTRKLKVRAMPESLKSISGFVLRCELAGVAPPPGTKWTNEDAAIKEVFKAHPTFLLSTQSRGKSGKLVVTLTHPDGITSVSEQLIKKGLAIEVKPEEDRLAPNYSCQVFVCFTEGLNFYVHQASQVGQLGQLQETLQTLALNDAPPHTNQTLLAARKPDDGNWYRALPIAPASDNGTPILFVDYGNKATCAELKQLPEEIIKIPPFATKCFLPIKPLFGEVFCSKEATERFESLTFAESIKSFKAKVFATSSDCKTLIADLIVGEENMSVTDILVSEKLVLPLITKAYISNVESPSEFTIQLVEDERKLQEMEERLAAEEFKNLDQVEVGTQCIAKFTADEAWYRARVIAVTENGTQVLFIDYGNSAVATEFKTLPADMASIPAMATLCTPKNMPSNDAESKMFLDQAMDGTVIYQVLMVEAVGKSVPMKVVLIKDGKDLMECIKEKCKKEMFVTVESKMEISQHTTTVTTEAMEVNEIEPKTMKLQSEIDTVEKMDTSKKANLTDVFISYYMSPSKFWYQKVEDEDKVFDIQERLKQLGPDEMIGAPIEGLVCAAQFKDDETWYRGKIISLDPQKTFFIDYGNTGEATAFKNLPEDLKSLPPIAKNASLMSIPKDAEICEKLKEILRDECTVFQVEISEEGNNKINVYKARQNLFQVVGYEPEPEPQLTDVIVSHYGSPNYFYVQINSELSKLDALQSRLEEGSFEPIAVVLKDMKCLAKFTDDNSWYRAVVTSITDKSITVFFYDYGNSATATEFKKITEELDKIPPMAKLCHLPFNPQKPFNQEAKEKLATLLGDHEGPLFQADLSNYKEGSSFGVTLMKDGVNVLEVINCDLQVEERETKIEVDGMATKSVVVAMEIENDLTHSEPAENHLAQSELASTWLEVAMEIENDLAYSEPAIPSAQPDEDKGLNVLETKDCINDKSEKVASTFSMETEAQDMDVCQLDVPAPTIDLDATSEIPKRIEPTQSDTAESEALIDPDKFLMEEKTVEDQEIVIEVIDLSSDDESEAKKNQEIFETTFYSDKQDSSQDEENHEIPSTEEYLEEVKNLKVTVSDVECLELEINSDPVKVTELDVIETIVMPVEAEITAMGELKKVVDESEIKSLPVEADALKVAQVVEVIKVVPVKTEIKKSGDGEIFIKSLPEKDLPDLEQTQAGLINSQPDCATNGQACELPDNKETEPQEVHEALTEIFLSECDKKSKPEGKEEVFVAETSKQKEASKRLKKNELLQILGINVEAADSSIPDGGDSKLSLYLSESSSDADDRKDKSGSIGVATCETPGPTLKSPSEPVLFKQALGNVVKLQNKVQFDESLEMDHSTSKIISTESPQISTSTPFMVASCSKPSKIPRFIILETITPKMIEPTSPTSSTESPPKKQIKLDSSLPSFVYIKTKVVKTKTPLEDKILPGCLSESPAKKKKMSPPEPKSPRGYPMKNKKKMTKVTPVKNEGENKKITEKPVEMAVEDAVTSTQKGNMNTEN